VEGDSSAKNDRLTHGILQGHPILLPHHLQHCNMCNLCQQD